MTKQETRAVIDAYLRGEFIDVSMLADDVLFVNMATGDEICGPQAVQQMQNYYYRIAFAARFELTHATYAENQAVLEGSFAGRHIGEFAGIPATGREVRVPMCAVYEVRGGKIVKARIYFEMPVLMTQMSAQP